jgi:hypothetical protein
VARTLPLADIFQLGYYWETKIVLTEVELDLFMALGEKKGDKIDKVMRLKGGA